MASPSQASTKAGGAVKTEPCDGHYDCFSCQESVRPDLKGAQSGGNDGNGAVLKCTACTAQPFHARFVGTQHSTTCDACRKLAVQPWSLWTQAGPVGGAIAVPDDGPDADADQKEGGQSVPVRGGKAAACSKRTANKTVKFLPFTEALLCARSLLLKNQKEWKVWCKSDARLVKVPTDPARFYKDEGWRGYGHWLGTGNIRPAKLVPLPFAEALLHARSLKLKGVTEWRVWCTSEARLANIPACPDRVYKHAGWQGYGHWLGTGNVGVSKDQKFLPFKDALLYARSLKLKNQKEWQHWCTSKARPGTMPSRPDRAYKHEGWQGYGHWLGTGNLHTKEFLPFKKALLQARSLKLKTHKEWEAWSKSTTPRVLRPANMPSRPDQVYTHEGWQGYEHWLGTVEIKIGKQESLPF